MSALIQFGQCTSQKLADTNVVNSTYPGDEDIEEEDFAERGLSAYFGLRFTFARCLLGVPPAVSYSIMAEVSAGFSSSSFGSCKCIVIGVVSVTSSHTALEWFPDIEQTSRKEVSI